MGAAVAGPCALVDGARCLKALLSTRTAMIKLRWSRSRKMQFPGSFSTTTNTPGNGAGRGGGEAGGEETSGVFSRCQRDVVHGLSRTGFLGKARCDVLAWW